MSSPSQSLPLREKIGYGLGDTASNIFFQFLNIFLLYYFTDVFGISPTAAGTLFLVTRLWDAFTDPLMGALSDRTQTRFGKYRPYLLWMALPFGICGYLLFANPSLSESGRLIYAYATYIGLMMTYTAINVPYSALVGVMTPSREERTSLNTFRFVGAFTGGLIIFLTVRPMVRELGGGDEALGFQITMAILAFVAVVLFLITFATTKERVKPQPKSKHSIWQDLGFLCQNRPWVIMVIAAFLTLANVAVRGGVTAHYFKYFVGDNGSSYWWFLDQTSLVLTTGSIAFIIGVFFTGMLGRCFGKRNALIALTLLNGLTILAFYLIPAEDYATMLMVHILGNLLAGPTPALVWSIYTDVVDYGEWKYGRRTPGLAFSIAMLSQKMGFAVGGAMAGWFLGFFSFVAHAEQSLGTLDGIRFLFCYLPGTLALANGLVLFGYRLSDDEIRTMAHELKERRSREEAL